MAFNCSISRLLAASCCLSISFWRSISRTRSGCFAKVGKPNWTPCRVLPSLSINVGFGLGLWVLDGLPCPTLVPLVRFGFEIGDVWLLVDTCEAGLCVPTLVDLCAFELIRVLFWWFFGIAPDCADNEKLKNSRVKRNVVRSSVVIAAKFAVINGIKFVESN